MRKGPVVIEVLKANNKAILFGQITDHLYRTLVDLGPIGVDKGERAKLLLTPPGYKDTVPAGYTKVKNVSFRPDLAFQAIPTPAGTPADAVALAEEIKMCYLSEALNPAPAEFVDPQ